MISSAEKTASEETVNYRKKKIAFLTATMPVLTETFILREYNYLTKSKLIEVYPFAIRRPAKYCMNYEYQHLVTHIFYMRPDHLGSIFWSNIVMLFAHPVKYLKALKVLFRCSGVKFKIWTRYIFHFLCGAYLARYLPAHGFHAIHAHFDSAGNIALFANLIGDIEFTITFHASDDLYYGMKPLLRFKLEKAKAVITESKYNVSFINLLTFYKYENKITCVYNSMDTKIFKNSNEKQSIKLPARFLSIGSFVSFKGYHTVIKALGILKQKNIPFIYRIIGDGNEEEKSMIISLAEQYRITDSVELLGAQSFSEVLKQLEWCDIEIMNSETAEGGLRDGFPTVIAEAMLAKRPVVSTYVSDIPNIIKHGETGYLIPEHNPEALADILYTLVTNYEQTIPVVRNAYQFAVKHFDININGPKLERILLGK
jgi:glycosyltransferase involved in cell wall biosynthesis